MREGPRSFGKNRHPVAPVPLGGVKRLIRLIHQRIKACGLAQTAAGHAHAHAQHASRHAGVGYACLTHALTEPFRHNLRRRRVRAGNKHHKLFPAVAEHRVGMPVQASPGDGRHLTETVIPFQMPEGVVVLLEEVDIKHDDRQRKPGYVGLFPLLQRPAVAESGQRIPQGKAGVFVALLHEQAGAHVEPLHGALQHRQHVHDLLHFPDPHRRKLSRFSALPQVTQKIHHAAKERIAQLFSVAGQTRNAVTEMVAGDIGATVKLKDVRRGNTLNGKGCDYRFDFIKYPDPKYRRAVKPVNEADAEKMMEILMRMREEDPTWMIEQSKELKQTIVSGQGEFHLRTLKWRIENNDKLPIEFYEPKIPYRETITKAARADYRHKKQSGGAGQFGEVHLIVEPYYEGMPAPDTYRFGGQEYKISVRDTQTIDLDWGGKLVFVNSIVGGAIDARFLPAILKGIMARMEQGPLTGSYARDVRIIVYDGKMHPVDSNEISFMLAGRNAFSTAFKEAGPKILEPVYDVEVSVPADYLGDVMSDLQGRRAIIMGMNSEKGYEKLLAKVPLKEMSSYSTSLSSITGGRASFTMKFSSYELVPSDVQDKLLKAYEATQAED